MTPTQHSEFSSAEAGRLLDSLEARLATASDAWQLLEVHRTAPIAALCEAFARLALHHHPRFYRTQPPELTYRATVLWERVRTAFWAAAKTEGRPPVPERMPRGTRPRSLVGPLARRNQP